MTRYVWRNDGLLQEFGQPAFGRRRIIELGIQHESNGKGVDCSRDALQFCAGYVLRHLRPEPRMVLPSIHAAVAELKVGVIDGDKINHAGNIA